MAGLVASAACSDMSVAGKRKLGCHTHPSPDKQTTNTLHPSNSVIFLAGGGV